MVHQLITTPKMLSGKKQNYMINNLVEIEKSRIFNKVLSKSGNGFCQLCIVQTNSKLGNIY